MNARDQKELITREFSALGFSILFWNVKASANGPDCWVSKGGRPISVEIKQVRRSGTNKFRVDPVSLPRTRDDLIAIIVNSEYVLIEPMVDHLKCCSPKGARHLTLLCKGSYP